MSSAGRDEGVDPRRDRPRRVGVVVAAILIAAAIGATNASAQDTRPPQTSIIAGPIGPTKDNQPTFTLESDEPNSSFTCTLDATATVPCGPLFYQPPQPLPEGFHMLRVVATDPAGNTDPNGITREFTVDRSVTGAKLAGAARQRVSREDLSVNLKLGGQEPLIARAEGVVRIGKRRLKTRQIKVAIEDRPTVKAQLTSTVKVERAISRALRRGKRVTVAVTGTFRDELGNEVVKPRTIVLR